MSVLVLVPKRYHLATPGTDDEEQREKKKKCSSAEDIDPRSTQNSSRRIGWRERERKKTAPHSNHRLYSSIKTIFFSSIHSNGQTPTTFFFCVALRPDEKQDGGPETISSAWAERRPSKIYTLSNPNRSINAGRPVVICLLSLTPDRTLTSLT